MKHDCSVACCLLFVSGPGVGCVEIAVHGGDALNMIVFVLLVVRGITSVGCSWRFRRLAIVLGVQRIIARSRPILATPAIMVTKRGCSLGSREL